MSPGRELVSLGTRNRLRELMAGSTQRLIETAFQNEGFAPDPDCTWDDGTVRRTLTEQYLSAVDWTDLGHVDRALRVFEELLEGFEDDVLWPLRKALRRDGYELAADATISRSAPEPLVLSSMAGLRAPEAIIDNLDRIQRAADTDPAQVIGSAKELVESTAKTVLTQLGRPVNDKDDLPQLVAQAQRALQLHPSSATPGPDGSDAVKKILGAVTTVTTGVAELRNRGYGTGHGASGRRPGLHPRHARLAVNAARTWCELILDTLADTNAPWQTSPPQADRSATG